MTEPAGQSGASKSRAFWRSSGHHLVARDDAGCHLVTDDLLRAWLVRPELLPEAESCRSEHALHAALMEVPRTDVPDEQLAALVDPDAADNYRLFLAFRDHLLRHPSLEAAYLALFTGGSIALPPLFIDQMVHIILHGALADEPDPLRLRAAELLFRSQKVTIEDGTILAADEETVEMHAKGGGLGTIGRLLVESDVPLRSVDLDVLDPDRPDVYWARSDRFDTVLDLSFGRAGLDAFCRVLEIWLRHMLGIETSIQPLQQIRDERWAWHVGLDGEATSILNDLYEGREPDTERMERLLALFRLEMRDPTVVRPALAGRPIYLGMAMSEARRLRIKPQNLLVNLPLARAA